MHLGKAYMGRSAILSIVKGADGLERRGIVWDRYQMIPANLVG